MERYVMSDDDYTDPFRREDYKPPINPIVPMTLDDSNVVPMTAQSIFHLCWGQARQSPSYDKWKWIELQKLLGF